MEALEIALPPRPGAVAQARTAVTRRFDALPPRALDDLRLLITELVSNAILHGQLEDDDSIRVRVERRQNTVHAEVVDSGSNGSVEPKAADPEAPGGFGLHLVALLSDRWGVEQDLGTRVWFDLAA